MLEVLSKAYRVLLVFACLSMVRFKEKLLEPGNFIMEFLSQKNNFLLTPVSTHCNFRTSLVKISPIMSENVTEYGPKTQEYEQEYQFFTSPEERHDLYLVADRLAEYVLAQNIGTIYFFDRAARMASIALHEFWNIQHPDMPLPNIDFLNPKGFVSQEDIRDGKLDLAALKADDKRRQGRIESPRHIRPRREILAELRQTVSTEDRSKPVLFFDTCVHRGLKIRTVADKFHELGLHDVHFGTVTTHQNRAGLRPDLVIADTIHGNACHPFGRDVITIKTYTSIHATPTLCLPNLLRGAILQDEIRRSIHELAG